MREMKNNGASWVGRIPSHWDVGRIDSFYTLRNTKVSDKDYPPLSVTKEGILPQLETAAKTNAHDDRKLLRKGDFAINSRSDRRGSCGISPYDGSVSLINTILAPKGDMNPRYYDWLFHTVQFADEFYKWGHGIVDDLWTTNYQDMKKINIPVPPIDEQQSIASYLDKQCAEIDALSTDIQSEIETLEAYKRSVITEAVTKGLDKNVPMKNSRIPWIGSVPAHWSIYRIADLYEDRNERGNEDLPLLSVSINTGVSDKELSDDEQERVFIRSEDKTKYKRVYTGDITYNMMRAWQGAFGAVRVDGMVSPAYVVAKQRGITEIDSRFIEALIRSPMGIEEMNRYSYGIMDFRKRLYWPQFRIIKVCLPDIEEQRAIADYIDSISAEIDSIIAQKREQLSVLADYKKSIIYEYVTGKKEVPAS